MSLSPWMPILPWSRTDLLPRKSKLPRTGSIFPWICGLAAVPVIVSDPAHSDSSPRPRTKTPSGQRNGQIEKIKRARFLDRHRRPAPWMAIRP